MTYFSNDPVEELRIRCDALRGLLFAECGFELNEIAAVEAAALAEALNGKEGDQGMADVLVSAAD